MKRFLTAFLLAAVFTNAMPLSLYANEYKFESGADSKSTFGKSTSSDDIVPINQETTNIRRNKDASYFPPSYGIFSGEIPTSQTSLYHNNDKASYGVGTNTGSVTTRWKRITIIQVLPYRSWEVLSLSEELPLSAEEWRPQWERESVRR